MRSITKIFKSQKGETLIESLFSVLICTLAIMLLSSMVLASNYITQKADKVRSQFYEDELISAENKTAQVSEGNISIAFKSGISTQHYQVKYYGKSGSILSYDK